MGIKGLFPFLREKSPEAIVEKNEYLKHYVGRTLALDASMALYQFLAAIRSGDEASHLANSQGEATSHIQGMANRVLRLLENGIKPIFVFDGRSPRLKEGTLRERSSKKESAQAKFDALPPEASPAEVYKAASATTKVTRRHNDDVKRLLKLMGVIIVEASGEAEATCAALVRHGIAYAAVTEDMDALTFGTPIMIKNLFDTEGARNRSGGPRPAYEIHLQQVLSGLKTTMSTFIDLCILSGCDYLDHISGVGCATAWKVICARGGSLERAVRVLPPLEAILPTQVESSQEEKDEKNSSVLAETSPTPPPKKRRKTIGDDGRIAVPSDWDFNAARRLFTHPDVTLTVEKAAPPDYDGLRLFLVSELAFSADRVDRMIVRLRKCKAAKPQRRLDSFFSPAKPRPPPTTPSPSAAMSPSSQQPQQSQLSSPPVTDLASHETTTMTTPKAARSSSSSFAPNSQQPHRHQLSPPPVKHPASSSVTTTKKTPTSAVSTSSSAKQKKKASVLARPEQRITNYFSSPSLPRKPDSASHK